MQLLEPELCVLNILFVYVHVHVYFKPSLTNSVNGSEKRALKSYIIIYYNCNTCTCTYNDPQCFPCMTNLYQRILERTKAVTLKFVMIIRH